MIVSALLARGQFHSNTQNPTAEHPSQTVEGELSKSKPIEPTKNTQDQSKPTTPETSSVKPDAPSIVPSSKAAPSSNNTIVVLSNPAVTISAGQRVGPFTATLSDGSSALWDTPSGDQHVFGYNLAPLGYNPVAATQYYIRAQPEAPSGVYTLKLTATSTDRKIYKTQISVTVQNAGYFTVSAGVDSIQDNSSTLIIPFSITRHYNYSGPLHITSYLRRVNGEAYAPIYPIVNQTSSNGETISIDMNNSDGSCPAKI